MEKKNNSNRIKIGIDARLWAQTGVGRYIRNLILNLLLIDPINIYVLFARKEDESEIKNQISKLKINNLKFKIVLTNIKWHSISEQISFPKIINKENLDVMHFTYQQGVPIFYKKLYVITVHDLIKHHFLTGKASTDAIWLYGFKMLVYKTLINFAVKNAFKIIAVSSTTRDEIFDHLMVNKNKVKVIYEASDDIKFTDIKNPNLGKYFLYVGNVYPHKNVDNLIKAFNLISEKTDVKLVFAGSDDYFYSRLKKQLSSYIKKEKIVIKENVNDAELAGLYKNATALVRPSFMEGFSLAPLEAMRLDCLVLASEIPVHKEIFGDNIYYFNPNDVVDLEKQMNYVLNLNENTKREKINLAKKLAGQFSWEKTAIETLEVYKSCIITRSV